MSNLKKLMQQKQQSARLTHPQAHYDTRGQLSCKTCGTTIKHASLFAPHLVSKGHRLAVQKGQEKEQAALAGRSSSSSGKRRREENVADDEHDDDDGQKRARANDEDEDEDEDDADGDTSGGLPSDFFADPSQAPVPTAQQVDDDDGDGNDTAMQSDPTAVNEINHEDDPEWAAFEVSLAAGPATQVAAPSTAQATIFAAPVEYEFGAPKVEEEGVESGAAAEEEEEPEETEEDRIARQELEEREEIMARIVEEEREQIEADEKVAALKRKMEAMRAARQAKKKSSATP